MTTPTPSPEAEALPTLPVVATSGWIQVVREPDPTKLQWDDEPAVEPQAPAEAAIVALRTEVAELRKDADRLDWLDANAGCEVSFQEVGDCEYAWQVHSVGGGRNDREWTLIGQGETPRAAIDAARASLLGDGGTL